MDGWNGVRVGGREVEEVKILLRSNIWGEVSTMSITEWLRWYCHQALSTPKDRTKTPTKIMILDVFEIVFLIINKNRRIT